MESHDGNPPEPADRTAAVQRALHELLRLLAREIAADLCRRQTQGEAPQAPGMDTGIAPARQRSRRGTRTTDAMRG